MERFFFNTHDGETVCDPDGMILDSAEAATVAATRFLAALVCDHPKELLHEGSLGVQLQDETGLTLLDLTVVATAAPALGGKWVGTANAQEKGAA